MEEKQLAYCGLICETCPVFVARVKNDDDLRAKTAREFSELYGQFMGGRRLTAEDMNCRGCKSESDLFVGCTTCVIRKCCRGKNLVTCARCAEYLTCKMLNGFYSMPENQPAKANLDGLRGMG